MRFHSWELEWGWSDLAELEQGFSWKVDPPKQQEQGKSGMERVAKLYFSKLI